MDGTGSGSCQVADFGINSVEALDQLSYLVNELWFKESHLLVCTMSTHKQPPLLRNEVSPLSGSSSRQLLGPGTGGSASWYGIRAFKKLEPSSAVLWECQSEAVIFFINHRLNWMSWFRSCKKGLKQRVKGSRRESTALLHRNHDCQCVSIKVSSDWKGLKSSYYHCH